MSDSIVFSQLSRRTRFGKVGFEHDMVFRIDLEDEEDKRYLERWISFLGPLGSLRLHRFWRSDNPNTVHDHPWWFITFPLQTYLEMTADEKGNRGMHPTKRLRFHFRSSTHRHYVALLTKPGRTWTIVLTGRPRRTWGFYPRPGFNKFISWKEYLGIE